MPMLTALFLTVCTIITGVGCVIGLAIAIYWIANMPMPDRPTEEQNTSLRIHDET